MKRSLAVASILSVVAMPMFVWAVVSPSSALPTSFQIELDGISARSKTPIRGGNARVEVVLVKTGVDTATNKRPGRVSYDPFEFGVGVDVFQPVVRAFLAGESPRISGSSFELDADGTTLRSQRFRDAQVSEVTFPASDTGARGGSLVFKVIPTNVEAPGRQAAPAKSLPGTQWTAVRVQIDGIDCARVRKVAAFTVKRITSTDGDLVASSAERLELPNLRLTVSDQTAASFEQWLRETATGRPSEKRGSIEFLAADGRVLAALDLTGLGIIAMERSPERGTAEAELYCETMRLR